MCQLKVPDFILPKSPLKYALSYSAVFTPHTLKVPDYFRVEPIDYAQ